MPEYVVTISVHITAENEEEARARLARLIKVSYRFKYMTEVEDDD
jgi:hypothetical protein